MNYHCTGMSPVLQWQRFLRCAACMDSSRLTYQAPSSQAARYCRKWKWRLGRWTTTHCRHGKSTLEKAELTMEKSGGKLMKWLRVTKHSKSLLFHNFRESWTTARRTDPASSNLASCIPIQVIWFTTAIIQPPVCGDGLQLSFVALDHPPGFVERKFCNCQYRTRCWRTSFPLIRDIKHRRQPY